MSSTSAPLVPSPPTTARKVPLPCWTHEETTALIDTYRDRWIALRKGYLRTADWDAVATAVGQRCGHVTLPKSSDQCRHKMEKLRQRYRAEKQRCVASPGKFFSDWIFFQVLSFLEDGGLAKSRKRVAEEKAPDPVFSSGERDDGFLLTALGDRKFTIDLKNFAKIDDKIQNPSFEIRPNIPFPTEQNLEPRMKRYARMETDSGLNHSFIRDDDIHEQASIHKGFIRLDKMATVTGYAGQNLIYDLDADGGGFNFNARKLDSSMKFVNSNNLKSNHGNSPKWEEDARVDPLAEMAASIKVLGDGFLEMEKMRMKMALEFEKARMTVELKRNEMIMESQRRIVDAFVKMAKRRKAKKQVHIETLDSVF